MRTLFYPQQESLANLLVQLLAHATETSELFAICGKQIINPHNDSVKFKEWVKDMINELGLLLTMAEDSVCFSFLMKTLTLVELANDLRTAMAEKDICGGLEIDIVPPDTLAHSQDEWMMDTHADSIARKVDSDESRVEFVAGTTGIGLQRKVSERVDEQY